MSVTDKSMTLYDQKDEGVWYEKITTQERVPVLIQRIELSKSDMYVRIREHWHRSLEFIIPIHNGMEVYHSSHIDLILPGDYALINSREIHSCRVISPHQDYIGYYVQIRYEFLKDIGIEVSKIKFDQTLSSKHSHSIYKILMQMIELYEGADQYDYLHYWGDLSYIMYHLMYLQSDDYKSIPSNEQRDLTMDVVTYIDDHYSENLTPKNIAKTFNISYGYLARLFKKYLRTTLSSTINSIRIEYATVDLAYSREPIKNIMRKCGFKNAKSFTREFKKIYGVTPKEYRDKYRRLANDG